MIEEVLSPFSENKLLARTQTRLQRYFGDFHELEGFAVLSTSIDRLFTKVMFEVRALLHETFEMLHFQRKEELERAITAMGIEKDSRENLCDHVIAEAQQLMKRFHNKQLDHDRKIQELHSAYNAREKLLLKTWCMNKDKQYRLELADLTQEYEKRVQVLEVETEQRIAAMKKHMQSTMSSELEFARIQLKMQAKAELERTHTAPCSARIQRNCRLQIQQSSIEFPERRRKNGMEPGSIGGTAKVMG